MDFFGRQDQARRATVRLVCYFLVAVALIFVAVNALLYLAAVVTTYDDGTGTWFWHGWSMQALVGTLVLVGGRSLVEWLLLRAGGSAVAGMLGARRIDYATRNERERQLLNVSEELAIASGNPVPALYVLDREPGINAFVAGLEPEHSVLVVTRGALERLDRDELQGVVGHEFSHILNGDMRLNMRLLALLAGILALGQAGGFLMRSVTDTTPRGAAQRNRVVLVYLFGLGLWLIGYVGLVCGRLIQAAIARERERLADAASVQFTRQPDGLAGALYKILGQGSTLTSWRAEQLSHMCFADSLRLYRLFATHPPLEERIDSVSPGYLTRIKYRSPGEESPRPASVAVPVAGMEALRSSLAPGFAPAPAEPAEAAAADSIPFTPVAWLPDFTPVATQASARVGGLTVADLHSAQALRRALPIEVTRALESGAGAKAVLFALLAWRQPAEPGALQAYFAGQPSLAARVAQLCGRLRGLDDWWALPVVELALPRLELLAADEAQALLVELRHFASLGGPLSVFGFALLKLVERQVRPPARVLRTQPLARLAQPVSRLVATLLQYDQHPLAERAELYRHLLAPVLPVVPPLPDPDRLDLGELERALHQCRYLDGDGRRTLLDLCAAAINSDGMLHPAEYALLRAVAALLSCPLPLASGTGMVLLR